VARRRAAAGRDRGGAVIQTARVARALAAVAGEAGVAAYAAIRADVWWQAAAAVGGALALLLAAAIFLRAAQLVPWTLLGLGALYAATLAGRALDGWAIAVGAALLLAAELAYWAIDDDPRLHVEPELQLRRAASIAAVVAAGLAAGLAVVIAAGVELGAGLPLTAAGAVAAVGLLLVVVGLATSSSASS
jgi:hypothetical protein